MIDLISAIVGIVFALVATLCFNLAIVFQKKGLNFEPDINIEGGIRGIIKSFLGLIKNKWWAIGALLGIGGWPFYIISIGLVGVLVTEPVMASGFLVFVIAAVKILDEQVSWLEYIAIGMLTISPVLLAFAGISNVEFDVYAFVLPLIIFLSITLFISLLSFYLSKKKRGTSMEALFMMFCGAILFALGGTFTNILARAIVISNFNLTWYSLFEILFAIFWWDYSHLLIFLGFWGMAIMNLSSMAFYQGAIQKGKAVVMYPILDSIALIIPLVAGLFVFQQTFENTFLFVIAIIFVMIGSLVLSRYQAEIETMDVEDVKEE